MEEKKKHAMSDAEFARRARLSEVPTFILLADLLKNDMRAIRAIREEAEFVNARPDLPRGPEFAAKVRGWLVANKLEWTQENLQTAVDAVVPPTPAPQTA